MKMLIGLFLAVFSVSVFADDAVLLSARPFYRDIGTTYTTQCSQHMVPYVTHRKVNRNKSWNRGVGQVLGGLVGYELGEGHRDRAAAGIVGAVVGGKIGENVGTDVEQVVKYRSETGTCNQVPVSSRSVMGYQIEYAYGGEIHQAEVTRIPSQHFDLEYIWRNRLPE